MNRKKQLNNMSPHAPGIRTSLRSACAGSRNRPALRQKNRRPGPLRVYFCKGVCQNIVPVRIERVVNGFDRRLKILIGDADDDIDL